VTHGGSVVSTHVVTVAAGETADIDVRVVFGSPRTGVVEVAGVSAGELTVAPAYEPSPTDPVVTDADGGGSGAGLLVVALLVGLWRRLSAT
jgi:hypothetical protein